MIILFIIIGSISGIVLMASLTSPQIASKAVFLCSWSIKEGMPFCSNKNKRRAAVSFYVLAFLSTVAAFFYLVRGRLSLSQKITFVAHPIVSCCIGRGIWISQKKSYTLLPTLEPVEGGGVDTSLLLREQDGDNVMKNKMKHLDFFLTETAMTIKPSRAGNSFSSTSKSQNTPTVALFDFYVRENFGVYLNFENIADGGIPESHLIHQWYSTDN